jgi:hypothetical protein
MKIIHSNSLDDQKVLVEFYEQDNYSGNSQKLYAGEYNRDQILIKKIKSMKLADGAVVTFFTDPGFTGQKVDIKQSVVSGGINFSCIKVQDEAKNGAELDDDMLDAVVGGRGGSRGGSRSSPSSCGADYSGVSDCASYSCGGAVCGAALCGGATCAADVSPSGVCGGNVCAANTCGVDSCGGNVCPAAVCGLNLCPANTCAADMCTVTLLPLIPVF